MIQLTDFSIEYDITPIVIPPISEVEAVAAVTTSFLRNVFQQQVTGLASLGVNYVGEDLAFPTYTIDYEVVATVEDGTTLEELDQTLNAAFQGNSLQTYIDLLQALPADNSFSRVTGVRRIATPEDRSASAPLTGQGSDSPQLPIPLLAGAGAASFVLIVLGVTLNRREHAAMKEGKKHMDHPADVTLAGDTFAGETYAGSTICTTSKSGKSHVSGDTLRSEYESAVRQFEEISEGYGTDSEVDEDHYYEDPKDYEEAKTELDDDEDDKSLSAASYSQYGGVVPVEELVSNTLVVNDAFMKAGASEGSADDRSVHSTLISGGSGVESVSIHSRNGNSTGSETSIHILETSTSDDDDVKRIVETKQAFDAYYSKSKSAPMHVPSVERNDYEDIQDAEGASILELHESSSSNKATAESLFESQTIHSFENIASKLGADLQQELKREPEEVLPDPIQRDLPDPPQEKPDEQPPEKPMGKRQGNYSFYEEDEAPAKPVGKRGNRSSVSRLIQKFA